MSSDSMIKYTLILWIWSIYSCPTVDVLQQSGSSTQFGSSLEIMRKLQQLLTMPTDGSTNSVNILFPHLNRWHFRPGWNSRVFYFCC